MRNKFYRKFVTILGDIKIFKYPLFFLYQPTGYKMRGKEVDELRDILQPGDILLRGYLNYLDGHLIPGFFSHAGFYYGDKIVIHAIAEGVKEEHIGDFCRCDYAAVMRFKPGYISQQEVELAQKQAKAIVGCGYDFEADADDNEYYCTEAVRKIYENKKEILKVEPTELSALFGLIKRKVILPDQFWKSPALEMKFRSKLV
jgi:hypothetical protein